MEINVAVQLEAKLNLKSLTVVIFFDIKSLGLVLVSTIDNVLVLVDHNTTTRLTTTLLISLCQSKVV